jgi:CRP-like cAMP-binding protein
MQMLKQALQQTFELSEEMLPIVLEKFQPILLQKKNYFLKEGQPVNHIGFIEEGITREFFKSGTKELTKFIGTPGDFISDVAGIQFNLPARWTIETITPCQLYALDKPNLTTLRNNLPGWNLIEKKFTAKCLLSAENRIIDHLQLNAEERYLKLLEEKPAIFNQVDLKDIASFLGITPETLSRFRNKHRK